MYRNFTIVIPTYNSSKYLEELLSSALYLKHLNELIIVDDNSKDVEFKQLLNIIEKHKYQKLNIKLSL